MQTPSFLLMQSTNAFSHFVVFFCAFSLQYCRTQQREGNCPHFQRNELVLSTISPTPYGIECFLQNQILKMINCPFDHSFSFERYAQDARGMTIRYFVKQPMSTCLEGEESLDETACFSLLVTFSTPSSLHAVFNTVTDLI